MAAIRSRSSATAGRIVTEADEFTIVESITTIGYMDLGVLGQSLQRLRTELGLTLQQLAELSAVSVSMLLPSET